MVFGGCAGSFGAGGHVYLAIAGGFGALVVDIGGVDASERGGAPRHAEDNGMEGGQSVGGDAKGNSLLCRRSFSRLRRGTFFGDAAAIAGTFDPAAAIRRLSGFLPAATGGA